MYDFGGGLFRNSPYCVHPLSELALLRLGVCPDDIKRGRFVYNLLINTVKDGVGRHIIVRSSATSVVRRALDGHFLR